MPARARRSVDRVARSRPSKRILPPQDRTAPMTALISDDLPAPLAPTSSTVSPSATAIETPRNAVTPP